MNLSVGNVNHESEMTLLIPLPVEFRFSEILTYLTRSPREILYGVDGSRVTRFIRMRSRTIWFTISGEEPQQLMVRLPQDASPAICDGVMQYIAEWFDIPRNLTPFYELARQDSLLSPLISRYFGLRVVGVPDLFEALCWAVVGQQINLEFAYTLKRHLVQAYGMQEMLHGRRYWLFPTAERIAQLNVGDLQRLQMTQRKSEYIIGIARAVASGTLSRSQLLGQGIEEAKRVLLSLRGVGEWTANYVAMRCLGDQDAYPVGDVGLQNAVKQLLGMDRKPTPRELLELGQGWSGWKAYATFYLWRSLQELV